MMRWTEEQQAIIESTGHLIRTDAYAGTGKTSTLDGWARAHSDQRILYLAFNRSVREEAKRRFPSHVTSVTTHAVAGPMLRRYQHKLAKSLRPYQIMREMGLDWIPYRERVFYAKLLIETLRAYFISTADTITAELVTTVMPLGAGVLRHVGTDAVARDAQKLWDRMRDPNDRAIGMPHDGYLKLFVLDQPRLPYDTVLFDEAQDANPITLQLMALQSHARQIFVGDPHQAIYGFRGAVNAMEALDADETYRLTGSFRFGSAIAGVGTRLLRWRDDTLPPLRGLNGDPDELRSAGGMPMPVTMITRTNAQLFAEAVSVMNALPDAKLAFIGGIDSYRFELIEDVYGLWAQKPETVRDPFVRLFDTFDELEQYAADAEDKELGIRCRLVKQWQHSIPVYIKQLRAAAGPLEDAQVAFATAHKSKGLEFPNVRLGRDFADLVADAQTWTAYQNAPPGPARDELEAQLLRQEELNIWYVAATRAQRRLYLPSPEVHQLLAVHPAAVAH